MLGRFNKEAINYYKEHKAEILKPDDITFKDVKFDPYIVPDYAIEGQPVNKMFISASIFSNTKDLEVQYKTINSSEEIEPFQYRKPVRLTTVEEILKFIGDYKYGTR